MKKIIKGKVVKPLSTVLIAGAVAMFGSTLFCTSRMLIDSIEYKKIESDFAESDILKRSKAEDKLLYYNQYTSGIINAREFEQKCNYLETTDYKNSVYKEYNSDKYAKLEDADNGIKANGLGAVISILSTSILGYAGLSEINRDTEEQRSESDTKERY